MLSVSDLNAMHAETPAPAAPAPAPAKAAPRGLKPNAYPGDCIKCGVRVGANEGLRDKRNDKWVVLHQGACPTPAVVPALVVPPAATPAPTSDEPAIAEGDYTLITAHGHRTFNVETDPKFADGTPVIRYLSGSNNEADWTGFGFVKGTVASPRVVVWKRFREDGYEALNADLALFLANISGTITLGLGNDPADLGGLPVGTVLLAKRCRHCHAKLTNPDSIAAGIGPVCATR